MKFDIQGMLEQAQKMQSEMEKIKNEIAQKVLTAESGGGMVKVQITGDNQIIGLEISPELLNESEKEFLEDLIVAAMNNAIKSAQNMAQEEMKKISGLLPNIPGLNLPF